ncbi:D-tagatose 3-epimerase [Lachnotalea glycerini]|uniref:D-psicose 3-epimerase n=1 Tax=Lachnotalea glycerini TaxID=1763509 RepID=A0A255IUP7_9FIRM|nr:sugar phosphate isomerase/epimerase family protein [Lachnotalea glycerini]PXV93397.1 D-tagatose 3-epimerase [Lachnotalea glycerini]RDY30286.1 sugar phosphate isomerase/epimerase [Lachnotalea glycerini]
MKYGIYFAYWEQEWGVEQKKYIAKVKELGFDILEISCAMLKNISNQELLELKKMADDNGIILTAGYGPNDQENLASDNPEIVKHAINFYTDILKKLEILNIHTFGGGIYSYWPVDYSKSIDKVGDWDRSVKNVRTVGKVAGNCGVDYCLEVLNRFEGYLLNTCMECKSFVEEVDIPAVKIMLDTFHMNIEEDNMIDAIILAGDKLGHFHVGENNRRLPGKGNLPWYEIGAALRKIGYDKNIVMEPFVKSGGGVGSDIKIWRDLSKGATIQRLDEDAKSSVAYLRYVFSGPNSDYSAEK